MSDSSKKPPKGKWSAKLLGILPIILAIGAILLVVRYCTESPGSDPSSSKTERSASQSAPGNMPSALPQSAAPQAKPIAMNTICAPFSFSRQMCTISPGEGSGYISASTEEKVRFCFLPEMSPSSVKLADRNIKELWVIDGGKEVKWEPGQAELGQILALKVIPNKTIVLIYWIAPAEGCSKANPAPAKAGAVFLWCCNNLLQD